MQLLAHGSMFASTTRPVQHSDRNAAARGDAQEMLAALRLPRGFWRRKARSIE
jgi:hypothetical protein